MWRGDESTGLALVKHGEELKVADVIKDSLPAYDFCHRPIVERVFNNIEEYGLILGHTRSATRSTVNPRNAHPFQHEHITLVHNGTIENAWDLVGVPDRPKGTEVDSDVVCLHMSRNKVDEEETLEKLKGLYTLIWHNAKKGTLNIARNERKPLYFAFEDKKNTMYWASEYTLLVHLMERRNIEIDGIVKYPGPNIWYEFKLDELRSYTKRPFVSRQWTTQTTGRGVEGTTTRKNTGKIRHGGGSNGTHQMPEPSLEELQEVQRQLKAGTAIDSLETDADIMVYLRERKKDRRFKHSGHPGTVEKVRTAQKALLKMGVKFSQAMCIKPVGWIAYKKSKGTYGSVLGRDKNGNHVHMSQVKVMDWQAYSLGGKIYINAVGVRKLDNGKLAIVGMEHPRHNELMRGSLPKLHSSGPDSDAPVEPEKHYMGPSGQLVSELRWLELTQHGCGECTDWISPNDHELVVWRGDPSSPICLNCWEAEQRYWRQAKEAEAIHDGPRTH